jgi:lysophospholipase L1-like esterase
VLGDSNIYLASAEIERALDDARFVPLVHGISGSGVNDLEHDWRPAVETLVAPHPGAVVVVALGTNDARFDDETEAFAAGFEGMLAAVGDHPVVWVTHTEEGGGFRPPANQRRIHEVIRAGPAAHPNLTVLDLADDLAAQPGLLGVDGIHYSHEGAAWFADQIIAAVSTRVGAGSPDG